MPPSSDCLCHIAPTAAMVDKFVEKTTQNTNKTQLLASNYGTTKSLIDRVTFGTRKGPFCSAPFVSPKPIGAEGLADISSHQMLPADKNSKSY